MASTPSASALSAVLRCRGNFWTRNPPTKRPATPVYSLGLAGGAMRDSPVERNRSNQASAWEAFLRGERAAVGGRLTVAYKSPQVRGKMFRKKEFREFNKFYYPKRLHSPGDAHSSAPCVQNALVRQLAHKLTPNLPGIDRCSKIIQMIKYDTCVAHICTIAFLKEISEFPAGVLKVSITSPFFMENAGQLPSFVLTGWSTLKSTCFSLTALVSGFLFLKLAVLWKCSSCSGDAPKHLQCQQDENIIKNYPLQANGQIHSRTSSKDSGQKITEDRPD
ncbi:uncharacterized protein LOC111655711 [Seriola lalandi dorsalis]|uniref:uncharacterized protein LOC111655711 n=1 Tax=Seriola lalandi dorsalis TaxID=1841481 RepID=UPI000C6FB8AC|nr:uncharacterized protein LOC111655711 [Seriola lalandi dorsalis]